MNENNFLYKQLFDEDKGDFETVSRASRKLKITRVTIYKFIESGVITKDTQAKIIASGYDPLTFKKI